MPPALSVSGQLLCERLLTDTRVTRSLRRPLFTLEPSAPASREASAALGSSGGHAPETGPVRPTSAPICGRFPEAALGSGPWACAADLREAAGPGASALETEQRSEDEALCGQRVGAPPVGTALRRRDARGTFGFSRQRSASFGRDLDPRGLGRARRACGGTRLSDDGEGPGERRCPGGRGPWTGGQGSTWPAGAGLRVPRCPECESPFHSFPPAGRQALGDRRRSRHI